MAKPSDFPAEVTIAFRSDPEGENMGFTVEPDEWVPSEGFATDEAYVQWLDSLTPAQLGAWHALCALTAVYETDEEANE